MLEDIFTAASHDQIGESIALGKAQFQPSLRASASLSGQAIDKLQEINQLINDLEVATRATNANMEILRDQLVDSQNQLDNRSAELIDLKTEADRNLHQLQATQTELTEANTIRATLQADLSATQQQLDNRSAELIDLKTEADRNLHQLQATQTELTEANTIRATLQADLSATQQQLDNRSAELIDLKTECEYNFKQLQDALEENEILLEQLHNTQVDLEANFIEKLELKAKDESFQVLLLGQRQRWISLLAERSLPASKMISRKILSLTYST
jgi:chromosome segregation ATPase